VLVFCSLHLSASLPEPFGCLPAPLLSVLSRVRECLQALAVVLAVALAVVLAAAGCRWRFLGAVVWHLVAATVVLRRLPALLRRPMLWSWMTTTPATPTLWRLQAMTTTTAPARSPLRMRTRAGSVSLLVLCAPTRITALATSWCFRTLTPLLRRRSRPWSSRLRRFLHLVLWFAWAGSLRRTRRSASGACAGT
jgi:hypothetical protein